MKRLKRLIEWLVMLVMVLYPLGVYWSLDYLTPRTIGFILLALILLRSLLSKSTLRHTQGLLWGGVVFCGFIIGLDSALTLRFYPALINGLLFTFFFSSLYFPPPVIERLARLQHPDLPEAGVIYTRKVTRVWCIFFLLNATVSLVISFYGSMELWSLYNGLIAYVLMGLLMAIEYGVRTRTQLHVR